MFILLLWVDLIETAISASTTASTTDCDFIPHGDSTVSTFFSIFQSTICRHMKKNIGDLVVDLRKNQHQQKIQCTLSNNNNITEQGTSEFSTKAAAKMQQKKPFIIIYLFYYMFIICLFVYFIIKSRLNWDCNKCINNCTNNRETKQQQNLAKHRWKNSTKMKNDTINIAIKQTPSHISNISRKF